MPLTEDELLLQLEFRPGKARLEVKRHSDLVLGGV
jgi:hypothetical protein